MQIFLDVIARQCDSQDQMNVIESWISTEENEKQLVSKPIDYSK